MGRNRLGSGTQRGACARTVLHRANYIFCNDAAPGVSHHGPGGLHSRRKSEKPMRIVIHILRKDLRSHWWGIALFVASTACWAWQQVHPHAWVRHNPGDLPIILSLSACIVLTVSVIHGEVLVGDRQFWLTRPYRWAGRRPAGIRPAGIRPAGIRPAGIRPAEIRPAEIRPARI